MSYYAPASAATSGEPELRAYTYQGAAEASRQRGNATHAPSCVVTPRDRTRTHPSQQQQPQQSSYGTPRSPAPSSIPATPFSESVFSKYKIGAGRDAPYVSPIRNGATARGAAASKSLAAGGTSTSSSRVRVQAQPYNYEGPAQQQQQQQPCEKPRVQQQQQQPLYDPASAAMGAHDAKINGKSGTSYGGFTPTHSPVPRTPPRYTSTEVTGHADLRYPVLSTERVRSTADAAAAISRTAATTPPTQRINGHYEASSENAAAYAPAPAAAEVLQHIEDEKYRFSNRDRYAASPSTTPALERLPWSFASAAAAPPVVCTASPSTCWLCETRCLTGPGSTWAHAPRLFFATASSHAAPASTLTLCATCAAAVGDGDARQASARAVLQRCQRTPALRYRTAAYVNAVREYKLLLELMAEKVVRACERMRRIQGVTPSSNGATRNVVAEEVCLDPDVDVIDAPLEVFSMPLQHKVLRQVVEALEALLQRDSRATQLAATGRNQSSGAASGNVNGGAGVSGELPYSEIMAPRERHLLLEEAAHVERQLFDVSAAMKAAAEVTAVREDRSKDARASGGVAPNRSNQARHPGAETRTINAHVVASPRPSHIPNALSARSPRIYATSAADADADRLSRLADPRRLQRPYTAEGSAGSKAEVDGEDNAAEVFPRGGRDNVQLQRSSSSSSSSRGRSPPPLTSPQRPSQRSAVPAPFPFSAAPHRDHSRSRSAARDADGQLDGQAEDAAHRAVMKRAPRTPREGREVPVLTRESKQTPAAPATSPGRRTMEAMVGSAMWATYRHGSHRNGDPNDQEEGEMAEATAVERSAERRAGDGAGHHRGNGTVEGEIEGTAFDADTRDFTKQAAQSAALRKDPENILLNYFAGRTAGTPALRVSPTTRSRASPVQQRHRAVAVPSTQVVPVASPDERSLVDAQGASPSRLHLSRRNDLVALSTTTVDTAGWQLLLEQERRRRHDAEDALLSAHTRIAALEQTTNDMAEELLAHRLSVTFRSHLEGMELLVRRWTLLAQNFCLQKSLLFADEAAAVVRAVQRDAYGLRSFPRKSGNVDPFVRRQKSLESERMRSNSDASPAQDVKKKDVASAVGGETGVEEEDNVEEELWVSREEGAEEQGERADTASARHGQARSLSDPPSVPPSTRSSQHTVLPPDCVSAAAPYSFPFDLRLKPLALHF